MSVDENALWEKALDLMPRGTQTMSKCPDQFVDGVYPKFVSHGKGTRLYGLDGREYLDFMCGLGPIILGYNHEPTNQAVRDQLEKGIIFSWPTLLESEAAELMREVIPCAEQTRFAKNGTDVDLAAVRIARAATGKEHIAKCGYHGWGDWHAVTMRPCGVPIVLKDYVHEFQYNDLASLEAVLLRGDIAGVILETQALTPPAPGFLQGVRDLCDKHESVLIFDEVVTGFRWDLGGSQKLFGVTPDLACFGKAMGNGLPISAICGKRKYMQELNHAFFCWDLFAQARLAQAAGSFYISSHLPWHYSGFQHELDRPVFFEVSAAVAAASAAGAWPGEWESTGGPSQYSGGQATSLSAASMTKLLLTYLAAGMKGPSFFSREGVMSFSGSVLGLLERELIVKGCH
jgi:glutamate-1-semialdehyde aminotransferase